RWPEPVPLPAAASYLACWFGDQARSRVARLLATAGPDVPVTSVALPATWDDAVEVTLAGLLRDCRTGVRIIVAGPEAPVMRAAAVARSHGAAAEELVLLADEAVHGEHAVKAGGRRVFCVTCRRPFDAVAALGEVVACDGCGQRLTVDHRFSRPHAAYLGWPTGLDLHH
ncbi:MAG TPA: dimethylamine monooxygenase subunit DmmA family protein, partial [Trebonia sp.]